jgi:hydrogenase maturation factor
MKYLPIGKISWDILNKLVLKKGFLYNKGIIQEAAPGVDIAALDLDEIRKQIQEVYNSSKNQYLIYKSDPITFPTPNPAKYIVDINVNDLVTSGAIPYGLTITILLPPEFTSDYLIEFQNNLSEVCLKHGISILGGHTEITNTVTSPIFSASMIGFVPSDYYISKEPRVGDVVICSGWAGAEGTGILVASGIQFFKKKYPEPFIYTGTKIGEAISIRERVLQINKTWHSSLHLVHDATEGGIYGALYECLASLDIGCRIDSTKIPLSSVTKQICEDLKINPYKLLSSGTVILICSKDVANEILTYLNEKTEFPSAVIGEITEEGTPLLVDEQELPPPSTDEVIQGLAYLSNRKK